MERTPYPSDLTDREWALIAPLLPPAANRDPDKLTTVVLTGVTALVRATAPAWAVVSAGRHNRFGFPDPGVLARWRAAGAQRYLLRIETAAEAAVAGLVLALAC